MIRLLWLLLVLTLLTACSSPDVVLSGGNSEPPGNSASGGGPAGEPPASDPYIRGTVSDIFVVTPTTENCVSESDADPNAAVSDDDPPVCNPDPDVYGSFLVTRSDGGAGEDKASVTVPESAGIARKTADGYEAATFADIADGTNVTVWITGPVLESYPVQVTATFVLIES